jgi:energy-coupling factor transporter ATP-binding protein EcfA2/histidinol phosphatase-like PHP family hydrolase
MSLTVFEVSVSILEDILAQPIGARFYRADMHIHSYGASHDVRDATMTPQAIVATAAREGLTIIAITDHNEIGNVEAALLAAQGSGIYVVPGIELSTPQGHLLCYLPTLDALRRLHGQLSIVDRGIATSRCQLAILDCLNLLPPLGGFGILAHVDVQSGFEIEVPGASPHKFDVLCHPALLGIELKLATSTICYAKGDPSPDRVRMGRERIKRLNLGSKQNLARVLNSDAHGLEALGRNAANVSRVTRYKMEAPSFEGLRIALEDADARVRIEDQIPQAVPRILGVHIDGGFLSGEVIQFNSNLNCIIGGRGTGKSTAIEAVRCLVGHESESSVVDSEVWPDELHLAWQDQAGQQHTLFRPKGGEVENVDNPFGPCNFDVDCFGQGEAARISVEAQTNPLALLNYLDKFVDLDEAIAAEDKTREELLTLQTEIEKAEQKVQLIPQYERLLSTAQQQLAALQKPEVKELIELQRQLATERELRAQILVKIQEAKETALAGSPKEAVQEILELAGTANLAVGATEFQAILTAATAFKTAIRTAEAQINAGLTGLERLVTAQFVSWKAKEAEAQKKIDVKRRELEALKVSFDMSYISKLAADEASHSQAVKNLKTWVPHLAETRKRRTTVLKQRWEERDRVATLRETFGRLATATLREALSDLQVSLKYARNAYAPDAADLIIQVMGWKTNQQPRAAWLVETLTVPVLLDAIQRTKVEPILAIQTPEGVSVFKRDEATTILERLAEPSVKFALERATLHDLPRLQVSRAIPDGLGGQRYIVRDFAKLSLGQKQSVLLALMLSSASDKPLIIDQPEDNLDGEFIYTTLVPVLRRAKERRQVIIVTHNPNVAVLGDAEQIVVMKAFNDRGEIIARGSIDSPEIRDAACAILEGAREAFLRRAKIYGIQVR